MAQSISVETDRRIAELIKELWDDRVAFVKHIIGVTPTEQQVEALLALDVNDFVAIKSGINVGKSTLMAWNILHYMSCRPSPKIICTSPSKDQLRNVLWPELLRWHNRMNVLFRSQFIWRKESYVHKDYEDWFAVCRTASKDNPEAMQGFHCLTEDHEILTKRGWIGIDEITTGDMVLSVPIDKDEAEWMPVTGVYQYPYEGEIYEFDGKMVSFAVTVNHRFVAKNQYGQRDTWNILPLEKIMSWSQFYVRRVSGWRGELFEVPEPFAEYDWSPEHFAEFLGYWIGDGGIRNQTTRPCYEIELYHRKGDKHEYIKSLLKGVNWTQAKDYYAFSNKDACRWLIDNVGRLQIERRIPRIILDAPVEILERFCKGLWLSDGTEDKGIKRGFYNTSKKLIDGLQEILIKLGRPATVGVNTKKDELKNGPDGRELKANSHVYTINWAKGPTDTRILSSDIKRKIYKGRVWCISTPYQTFYTRRKGRVFLSGNSEYVMRLIDEGSGVEDEVYEVLEGATGTKETKELMCGNPTRLEGPFYDAFHKSSDYYRLFTFSSLDSPIAPKRVIERIRRKYGEDSNMYRVRVLGKFPLRDNDSFIPYDWAVAALQREIPSQANMPVVFGCDIARQGDDSTVIAIRQGDEFKPYHVLQGKNTMEVARYIARLANQHRPQAIFIDVIGLGCFDEKTEILTRKGWQKFSELQRGIPVLTMNPETFEAEYIVPERYFSYPYEGEMFMFEGQTVNFCITPNHNLFFKGIRSKSWKIEQVRNIDINQIQIPRSFVWRGEEREYFVLSEITKLRPSLVKGSNRAEAGNHELREYAESEKLIEMDVWLEFLGWFLSEGYTYERNNSYFVGITQSTESKKPIIRHMLGKLGFHYKEKVSNSGESHFLIYSKQLYEHVKCFGTKATEKRVPQYVKELSPRQIRIFLDAYMLGDGGIHKGMKQYRTSSRLMADDLQELVLKAGGYASVSCREVKGTGFFIDGHYAKRTSDTYVVSEWKKPVDIQLRIRDLKKVYYKGNVYCVEVNPYHLIYVRREGKCMWSGNSGVYDRLEELGYPVIAVNVAESPAYEPDRYERMRDELWGLMRDWLEMRRGKLWDNEDQDLVGQLTTPKYKITAKGKIKVESKDEMKKRGVDSPDIADAHNLTFAQPISNYQREVDEFWEQVYGDAEDEMAYALDEEAGY